jgi:hypothetical protein
VQGLEGADEVVAPARVNLDRDDMPNGQETSLGQFAQCGEDGATADGLAP